MRNYARRIALAFQIAADVLDIEGSERVAGKRLNKDEAQGKSNFVTVLELDDAKSMAAKLDNDAISANDRMSVTTTLLREIAIFAASRDRWADGLLMAATCRV
ncbi:polyprenyl synthetase family protein [Sphingomonas crocodyli]|uniref:Polyprenyl synthetase family protein n=1 Tax=Sphingomonas crocodyli TaxID=1979270 RepID=A0A437LXX5_9SPHN|nr:polyprenyl synthetase family protein [Sphingomonas crocodyli]RVT90250.1 hypothetical protein EOD43_18320 [Sphingomonas crocodyli]